MRLELLAAAAMRSTSVEASCARPPGVVAPAAAPSTAAISFVRARPGLAVTAERTAVTSGASPTTVAVSAARAGVRTVTPSRSAAEKATWLLMTPTNDHVATTVGTSSTATSRPRRAVSRRRDSALDAPIPQAPGPRRRSTSGPPRDRSPTMTSPFVEQPLGQGAPTVRLCLSDRCERREHEASVSTDRTNVDGSTGRRAARRSLRGAADGAGVATVAQDLLPRGGGEVRRRGAEGCSHGTTMRPAVAETIPEHVLTTAMNWSQRAGNSET